MLSNWNQIKTCLSPIVILTQVIPYVTSKVDREFPYEIPNLVYCKNPKKKVKIPGLRLVTLAVPLALPLAVCSFSFTPTSSWHHPTKPTTIMMLLTLRSTSILLNAIHEKSTKIPRRLGD